jgi:hypothetical protein
MKPRPLTQRQKQLLWDLTPGVYYSARDLRLVDDQSLIPLVLRGFLERHPDDTPGVTLNKNVRYRLSATIRTV